MNFPILTTLSYSGGVQSNALLEMVLRGDIKRPENFVVLNANPGMEDGLSLAFAKRAAERCKDAGIEFVFAKGPDLYYDLTHLAEKTHLDNPPYWTKNKTTGKMGRLKQGCTKFYKIDPMARALRQVLHDRFDVSLKTKRLPPVECWIGFAGDETSRVKPRKKRDPKFITLRYPLIELGMDRSKIEGYYLRHSLIKPPRSVCNACFANGLAYLEDMHDNRPDEWDKAVAVDDSVRDLSRFGVQDEVYVSATLTPLRDLPSLNFFRDKPIVFTEHRCNSGVCFL